MSSDHQQELLSQIPEAEREVLLSVIEFWSNMGITVVGASPLQQLIGVFDIAKHRLDGGKEVLRIIYDGEHTPPLLRSIIQPFLEGGASKEETKARLDECTSTLQKWLPALLLESSAI